MRPVLGVWCDGRARAGRSSEWYVRSWLPPWTTLKGRVATNWEQQEPAQADDLRCEILQRRQVRGCERVDGGCGGYRAGNKPTPPPPQINHPFENNMNPKLTLYLARPTASRDSGSGGIRPVQMHRRRQGVFRGPRNEHSGVTATAGRPPAVSSAMSS